MRLSEIQDHLSRFRVGIAGAGGLGSNCAVALARCGVGTLVISDFDVIEPANLNRQYFFLNQVGIFKATALKDNIALINPEITVISYSIKLDKSNIPDIYSGCDIIVEAFDSDDMKELLIETVLTRMPGIPVIVGSGLAGWGHNEAIRYRKVDETLYICGDESSSVSDELPPTCTESGNCGKYAGKYSYRYSVE